MEPANLVNKTGIAVIFALLAFFCLASMGVLAKLASPHASSGMIVCFQNLLSFLIILPIVLFQVSKKGLSLKTQRLSMHLFRAITGAGTWYIFFFALSKTSLTIATLLTYSSPLWMAFFAWLLFKEQTKWHVWTGVFLGFLGIMLVLNPAGTGLNIGAILAIIAAISMCFALFSVRWLGQTEPLLRMLFYYFMLSTLMMAPLAFLHWKTPDLQGWTYLLGTGLAFIGSQTFLIFAYRFASPVSLAPYIYSAIVFTAVLDWFIWDQRFLPLEWAGIALVMSGGVLAAIKWERKKEGL